MDCTKVHYYDFANKNSGKQSSGGFQYESMVSMQEALQHWIEKECSQTKVQISSANSRGLTTCLRLSLSPAYGR